MLHPYPSFPGSFQIPRHFRTFFLLKFFCGDIENQLHHVDTDQDIRHFFRQSDTASYLLRMVFSALVLCNFFDQLCTFFGTNCQGFVCTMMIDQLFELAFCIL